MGRGVTTDLSRLGGEPLSSSARLALLAKLHYLPRKGGEGVLPNRPRSVQNHPRSLLFSGSYGDSPITVAG
jgi:hypothetical protein